MSIAFSWVPDDIAPTDYFFVDHRKQLNCARRCDPSQELANTIKFRSFQESQVFPLAGNDVKAHSKRLGETWVALPDLHI